MSEISAVIITYNEELFIEKCLSSLEGIADEIVVVDSFSTDSTEAICNKFNVKFIKHKFEGYVEQKNFALTLSQYPLVLSLDGDEALSDELRESILKIKINPDRDGYYFNRLNNYCGKWIRHSRWYPDRHLKLFNVKKGRWVGPNPHDRFMLYPGGRSSKIKGDLYHWTFLSIKEHIEKTDTFSTISAEEYLKTGIKSWPLKGIIHMVWGFFRSYIICGGFLDGRIGYTQCSISAYGTYLKYSKLRKLKKVLAKN
jgi:glycosyltransferase involved in cell wall biosynthesis